MQCPTQGSVSRVGAVAGNVVTEDKADVLNAFFISVFNSQAGKRHPGLEVRTGEQNPTLRRKQQPAASAGLSQVHGAVGTHLGVLWLWVHTDLGRVAGGDPVPHPTEAVIAEHLVVEALLQPG